MKIGMVTAQFAETGGVENVVKSVARELAEDHEVSLIVRDREQNAESFDSCFSDVHIIEGSESFSSYLRNGRRFFKEHRDDFDVYHFHNWSTILPYVGIGHPSILTLHGSSTRDAWENGWWFRLPLYWLAEEIAYNTPDVVTSGTRSVQSLFAILKRSRVVRNGVDTDRFRPMPERREELREKWSVEGEGILICALHRHNKGHKYLFEAASELEEENTVMVTGTGPLTDQLKEKADETGVNAEFYGRVPDSELPELYAAADLFCLPSWAEGLPLAILEAMSAGLPVVLSDISDNRELVEKAKCGVTVPPKDPESLEKALRNVIGGEFDRGEIRSYAVEKLDWSRIADEYMEVYKNIT
ncbi:MAG: glycosyltransferase family 4 protein [Candidatus Nanohaloarchaea archaeon]|nr:glycosyltransferase family 4 protein [Candidatus Nanohaloarchaea archaeon]